jgi:hypothetical protein
LLPNFTGKSLPGALSALKFPDMNTPCNPSPGSGWWMASDGQWYPQKWEHYLFHSGEGDLQTAMDQTLGAFGNLGSLGWELVNFQVVPCASQSSGSYAAAYAGKSDNTSWTTKWMVWSAYKRPILPR